MTEAEIQDLEECSQMFDFTGFTPEEDKRLIAEVRRLQEALLDYGQHGQGPDHRLCPKVVSINATTCTCGFDAALAREA